MSTGPARKKLSLQARLIVSSALAVSLTSLVGVFCAYELKNMANKTGDITEIWVPSIQALAEIRARSQALRVSQFDLLAEGNKEKVPELIKNCDALAGDMFIYNKSFSKLIQDDGAQKIFDSYSSSWDAFTAANDAFLKDMKDGRIVEARVSLEKGTKSFATAQDLIKQLDDLSYNGSMQAKAASEQLVTRTTQVVAIALPVIFILSMTLIWYVTRRASNIINLIASDLRDIAEQLLIKGDNLANTSNQLSNSTTKEAEALHEALETTNAINAKVTENSARAIETTAAIQQTRDFANTGRNSIGQVTEAMTEIDSSNQRILEHVENNNDNMQVILEIMHSIEGKTKVINDIVFQTKLLSFNASVEAARAGESGKGFSVVAEEIAKLAAVSGSAAQEIGAIIDSSSQKVKGIVANTREQISSAVAESAGKIKHGVSLSEDSLRTLEEIVGAAEKASGMAQMISTASSEQARSVNEISVAMGLLTETTQANSSLAGTTANESKELGADSSHLSMAIERLEYEIIGSRRAKKAA